MAQEFLAHARALRAAKPEERLALLRGWGGATIAYRRRLIDSPSYTLNHEEVTKAMEEGIFFVEMVAPLAVEIDHHGAAAALKLTRATSEGKEPEVVTLPARAILI